MIKQRLTAIVTAFAFMLSPILSVSAEAPRGTFYEIYVRAFADSDGDGTGDLNGVTEKLQYLSDLGIGGIWLMPVFDAKSDHGYDSIDYRKIDSDYGTDEDMRALLDAAHEKGISVILDLVLNHTSTDCPWFQDALSGGEKRDWYRFYDEESGDPSLLSAKPLGGDAWHDSKGGEYYGVFWDGMPDLNLSNEEVKNELIDIALYWLEMGVDGFRLDATSHFFAYGEEALKQETKRSGEFLKEFQTALRSQHPDCYIVGEAWESLEKRKDIIVGIDSVFNFDFSDKLIALLNNGGNANTFIKQMHDALQECESVNADFLDAVFLSNHDQNRILSQLKRRPERYKLAAGILLTFEGNPFLYYGEEIGMQGAKPDEQIRTPMLWGGDDASQCTFIESKYNKKTLSLAEQKDDPDSLYSYVRSLVRLRKEHDALLRGALVPIDTGNLKLMAYMRASETDKVLVIHNLSSEPQLLTGECDISGVSPDALLFGALTDGMIPAYTTIAVQK
ncbi:MAG: alpha-amylase family glycosyl hydrolase [Eubacteriales bacterium]|nr:alpha-amylase family glycosyl hydrolase [Eubacteriales bacterium]MDD3882054.1 alpha-amylase family glycosyl hydrolase [Eubacteriales bacterium]MDD4512501.1 alpha-amylase family glycosyl hydrolase [Eubacteriales bacterium]